MPETTTARGRQASGMSVAEVAATLRGLRDEILDAVGDDPAGIDPSLANMRAYLALRRHDIRPLQAALARLGLSSLGRSEGHVLATLEQVLRVVEGLGADAARRPRSTRAARSSPDECGRSSATAGEIARRASWSRCPARPRRTATWSARSRRPAWTARGSTRPMTTRPPGSRWRRRFGPPRTRRGDGCRSSSIFPDRSCAPARSSRGPRWFICARATTIWGPSSPPPAPGSPPMGRGWSRRTLPSSCRSPPSGWPRSRRVSSCRSPTRGAGAARCGWGRAPARGGGPRPAAAPTWSPAPF